MSLDFKKLDAFAPLDEQRDTYPERYSPVELEFPLFGDFRPFSADPQAPADGDAIEAPPLHCYAIVDAGRIAQFDGPQSVAPTPCESLFFGEAATELSDVAPYILQLSPDDRFLQRLMTQSDNAWDHWDRAPAVYLRTSASPGELVRHFRSFVRVQDPEGKWFYFRFWEPKSLLAVLRVLADHPSDLARFLFLRDGTPIHSFIVPTPSETWVVKNAMAEQPERKPFVLRAAYRQAFDANVEDRFAAEFAQSLITSAPRQAAALGISEAAPIAAMIRQIVSDLAPHGFERRSDLARLASCALFFGTNLFRDPRHSGWAESHLTKARFHAVSAKRFEEVLTSGPLFVLVSGAAGTVKARSALQGAFATTDSLAVWLGRLLRPDWGFSNQTQVNAFIQLCHDQQIKAGLLALGSDTLKIRAHYVLACLYGPHFLVDPLHDRMRSVFTELAHFEDFILSEMNRRADALDRPANG